jgi:hypothetical protein
VEEVVVHLELLLQILIIIKHNLGDLVVEVMDMEVVYLQVLM